MHIQQLLKWHLCLKKKEKKKHNLITDYLHGHPAGVHFVLSKRLKTCREKNVKQDSSMQQCYTAAK